MFHAMKRHTQSKRAGRSSIQEKARAKNQNEGSILQAYKKSTAQLSAEEDESVQQKENKTGLPDNLKAGVENLSGYSLDDVKVHYNSSQPATLQAHAYAQGTDIHVAPGQEKHLPHEAWHVVQQKQGRVQPTKQLKGTTNINDDAGLEKEADVMGAKSLNTTKRTGKLIENFSTNQHGAFQLYSEQETEDNKAINMIVDARKDAKMFNRSSMTHNFACDYNNPANYARSQSNRHSEPMVSNMFLVSRNKKKKLVILSERQPCKPCENDLRLLEANANPELEIKAYYFIPYAKGEGKEPLVEFYEEKGKI